MMGYFARAPGLYEYVCFDNWLAGICLSDIGMPLQVEPMEPHYGGPAAVLIDESTLSSGEGYPMISQRLPQGRVVGMHGMYGSFGMCCPTIRLPGDSEVQYPPGQSRDAVHRVQLDSDHTLEGGLEPGVRVPLTRDTVRAMYLDGVDVVLRYAMEALREGVIVWG
jgi:carboxyl-terminal processing protease